MRATARSGLAQKQRFQTLRPLRALFETEVGDLKVLLGNVDSPCLEDIELYLARLGELVRRWKEMDPDDLLGLTELTDAAVIRVNALLNDKIEYGIADRIKKLLVKASSAAHASSLKQRLTAPGDRLDRIEKWTCHYCREREAENETSVLLEGRKETHTTRSGNTIIHHISVSHGAVPRCPRCADLHEYFRWTCFWTWWLALPFFLVGAAFLFSKLSDAWGYSQGSSLHFIVALGVLVGSCALSGPLARWICACWLTPKSERRYWDITTCWQYEGLQREGYSITAKYHRSAFATHLAKSKR